MDEVKKKCVNCVNYKGYYTKGLCELQDEGIGYCKAKEEIVAKFESCALWESNEMYKRERFQASAHLLNEILTQITQLKEVLTDEKDTL